MSTDPDLIIAIKAKAFKAGARWCSKNGADYWSRLDQDAKHYAETTKEVDHGGFVAVRSGHVDEQ